MSLRYVSSHLTTCITMPFTTEKRYNCLHFASLQIRGLLSLVDKFSYYHSLVQVVLVISHMEETIADSPQGCLLKMTNVTAIEESLRNMFLSYILVSSISLSTHT